jgi:hypothetical protein
MEGERSLEGLVERRRESGVREEKREGRESLPS